MFIPNLCFLVILAVVVVMSVAKYMINDHDVWMMATLSWPGMLIMTMIVVGEVVFVIFVVVFSLSRCSSPHGNILLILRFIDLEEMFMLKEFTMVVHSLRLPLEGRGERVRR